MNESPRIELYNARYQMQLRGGGDIWSLYGQVYGHPNFPPGHHTHLSSPLTFDPETDELDTCSGSRYIIKSYEGDKQKVVDQIKTDIANGGYEVH